MTQLLAFQSLSDWGYYRKLAIQVEVSHYGGFVRKSAQYRWGGVDGNFGTPELISGLAALKCSGARPEY